MDASYAESVGQDAVCGNNVAHRQAWKCAVVRLARVGIHAQRARGAVARAKNVGTHYEIAFRVEETAGSHCAGPPVGHIAVGREGVAHPHHVVGPGRQRAVGMVRYGYVFKRASAFKRKLAMMSVCLQERRVLICLP